MINAKTIVDISVTYLPNKQGIEQVEREKGTQIICSGILSQEWRTTVN